MKKIKILILFLIIIVLTGCNSDYKVTINKDLTVKEEGSFAADSQLLISTGLTSKDFIDLHFSSEIQNILKEKGYNYELSPNNSRVLVDKEYKSLKEFADNTYAIKQFFEDIEVTESNGVISFKTGKFIEQDPENQENFYVESIPVVISSVNKFKSSNSLEYNENDNSYTWYISSDDLNNSIEFEIDTNDKYISPSYNVAKTKVIRALLFIIGVWIFVAILFAYRKNKDEYY